MEPKRAISSAIFLIHLSSQSKETCSDPVFITLIKEAIGLTAKREQERFPRDRTPTDYKRLRIRAG
jgi:hypothetical protein